jgi:perosamine synthetase
MGFMIPVAQPTLDGNEKKYVLECFDEKWIAAGGRFVKGFEEGFSKFCGSKYGIATSSGTTALHLALMAIGIKPGDEVIVPDLTFAATANCALHSCAKPVLVDVDPQSWTMDPEKIAEKITPRTKAIIPVHLYGHPADMDPILEIARDHKLTVIEDACPAHGSEYKGRRVGSLGDMACFSFHASKLISTGEGGIITTNNPDFVDRATLIRDQGMRNTNYYWHPVVGYNYRLTNVQAAIGVAQLETLEEKINLKMKQIEYYHNKLRKIHGITVPTPKNNVKQVRPFYTILVEDSYGMNRDELDAKLKSHGIDRRPVFYPLHSMPPYKEENKYPVATEIGRKGLQIPSSLNLTHEQIDMIVDLIKQYGK